MEFGAPSLSLSGSKLVNTNSSDTPPIQQLLARKLACVQFTTCVWSVCNSFATVFFAAKNDSEGCAQIEGK